MAPNAARWIYGRESEQHTWYGTVRIFRDWDEIVENVKTELTKKLMESERMVANG